MDFTYNFIICYVFFCYVTYLIISAFTALNCFEIVSNVCTMYVQFSGKYVTLNAFKVHATLSMCIYLGDNDKFQNFDDFVYLCLLLFVYEHFKSLIILYYF